MRAMSAMPIVTKPSDVKALVDAAATALKLVETIRANSTGRVSMEEWREKWLACWTWSERPGRRRRWLGRSHKTIVQRLDASKTAETSIKPLKQGRFCRRTTGSHIGNALCATATSFSSKPR
jgi:hypothetical protein